jgi:hypothetical protein
VLGFRWPAQRNGTEQGRRRTRAPRAFPLWRYTFYRRQRAAAFIVSVGEAAADRSIPSTPPSCLRAWGRRRPERVSWVGCWWASWWAAVW